MQDYEGFHLIQRKLAQLIMSLSDLAASESLGAYRDKDVLNTTIYEVEVVCSWFRATHCSTHSPRNATISKEWLRDMKVKGLLPGLTIPDERAVYPSGAPLAAPSMLTPEPPAPPAPIIRVDKSSNELEEYCMALDGRITGHDLRLTTLDSLLHQLIKRVGKLEAMNSSVGAGRHYDLGPMGNG